MSTSTHPRSARRFAAPAATLTALLALGATTPAAFAQYTAGSQLTEVALSGTTSYDGWETLSSAYHPGYPGFPGSGAWPAPIGSTTTGSGDATLAKLANGPGGGPYPAGGSIYYGGFSAAVNTDGGTLAVQDATPVAGLANLVLQIEIGEAWTYDFFNDVLPTLSYTTDLGTTTGVAATFSLIQSRFDNGTVTMPTGDETVYINSYLLQWDLSGVSEDITSFSLSFTGVQHAQLYALQLDQSSVYTSLATPVPEPATYAVIAGALALAGALGARRAARRK